MSPTIQESLRELSPATFASKFIFEAVPYIFDNDLDAYIEWKTELGASLGVDPRAIAITGSAGVGISLNPHNNLRPFNEKSDIDVAVVSAYHFEIAWRHLRSMTGSERLKLGRRQRDACDDHRTRLVYWGAIASDRILEIFPFALTWVPALNNVAGRDPTTGRKVHARIFRDFDALRAYQLQSVTAARDKLLAEEGV